MVNEEEEKAKKVSARNKKRNQAAIYDFGKEAEGEMARRRAVQSGMNWKLTAIAVGVVVFLGAWGYGLVVSVDWLKEKITAKVSADQKCASVQERVAIAMERAFPAPLPGYNPPPLDRGLEEAVNEEAAAALKKIGEVHSPRPLNKREKKAIVKKVQSSIDCLMAIPAGKIITDKDMDFCENNYPSPQILQRRHE